MRNANAQIWAKEESNAQGETGFAVRNCKQANGRGEN